METATEQREINFSEVLDQLNNENQQEILGVLEGLFFAQNKEENDD